MPCYQSTNLPGGFSTTGRTSYATEADCLQACKEGACCEGTTCTVKPQCQCQCTTGGNCCGPDTATVGGVTGKVCRGGTKQECDQRGGTWTCGYACSADEKTGIALCSSAQLANPNLPVFKGVGTTCASLNGACCEDGPAGSPPTCSIKTSCECVGQGKRFVNIGTKCENVNCCRSCQLFNCLAPACIPQYITVSYSASMPDHYNLEVGAYCDGFSISGTVTTTVQLNNINVNCGRYVFSGSGAALGGFDVQVTGERGYSVVTVKRGFTLLGSRDYPDGSGGVQQQPYGSSSATTSASGASATFVFPVTGGSGAAFLGGESSGYCYRSGTSQLGRTYFPSHRLPGFFGVQNPVPAVNDEPCGSLTVISAYGSGP